MLVARRVVLRMAMTRRAGATLQKQLSSQAAESTVPLQLYLDLMRQKDAKIEEKDARIEEKDAKIEERERERMQLLKEKDAKIEERERERMQLLKEKDAKIDRGERCED